MQLLLVWQQFVFNTDSISVPYYISTQPNLFLRETSFTTLRDCWVIIFGFMNTIYSRSEVVNMCTEFFFSPSLFLIWLCLSVSCVSLCPFYDPPLTDLSSPCSFPLSLALNRRCSFLFVFGLPSVLKRTLFYMTFYDITASVSLTLSFARPRLLARSPGPSFCFSSCFQNYGRIPTEARTGCKMYSSILVK